ncbi:MAG: aminoacyl-tRNA hydrolase [Hyphomicrobiaceae bacterium]|nr:aminoacyl-tRNA hydrolase [Hyphomicrobiaceae bacterium]
MKLLVGLGNYGPKYEGNRHNVGFMAVDVIAERYAFGPWKRKFQALAAEGEIAGERVLLLKPQTYMNESGRSVAEAARFLKIPLADITVLYDEIDLAPGKLKVKTGGGNAGHNGLRSITAHLGNDYARVRIGVGHPGDKSLVANYVLSDFAKADRAWLEPLLAAIAKATGRLVSGDQARFQTDVAREISGGASDTASSGPASPSAEERPSRGQAERNAPSAPRAPHPAGERQSKRQGALAANLQRWLAGRKDDK